MSERKIRKLSTTEILQVSDWLRMNHDMLRRDNVPYEKAADMVSAHLEVSVSSSSVKQIAKISGLAWRTLDTPEKKESRVDKVILDTSGIEDGLSKLNQSLQTIAVGMSKLLNFLEEQATRPSTTQKAQSLHFPDHN